MEFSLVRCLHQDPFGGLDSTGLNSSEPCLFQPPLPTKPQLFNLPQLTQVNYQKPHGQKQSCLSQTPHKSFLFCKGEECHLILWSGPSSSGDLNLPMATN